MDLDAVLALSDRFTQNPALSAWFAARYPGKQLKRLVGYKRSSNANDFPYLSFVVPRQQKRGGERGMSVSVVLGIHEPDLTADGIFEGVRQSAEALNLMIQALTPLRIVPGLIIDPDWSINSDLGMRHPFYESELSLALKIVHPIQYLSQQE